MLASIGKYSGLGFQFLEKGLAHPTFLGRMVSWGVFYGVLAYTVVKVAQYAIPKIKQYWEDRKTRLEGNIPSENSVHKPIKDDVQTDPQPLNPAPQTVPSTSELDQLDHKEGHKAPTEPGEGVKKKTPGWFKG
jgi:hypothetical protein